MNIMSRTTLKNLKFNKKRTIVTVIGVILSISMITAVTSFASSLQSMMLRETIAAEGDWLLQFTGMSLRDYEWIKDERRLNQAFRYAELGYAAVDNADEIGRHYWVMLGMEQDAMEHLAYRLVEGEMPRNDSEVLLPERAIGMGIDLRVGDTLTLQTGKRQTMTGEKLSLEDGYQFNENGNPNEQLADTVSKTYTITGIYQHNPNERYTSISFGLITKPDWKDLPVEKTVYMGAKVGQPQDIFNIGTQLEKQLIESNSQMAKVEYHKTLLEYMGILSNNNFMTVLINLCVIVIVLIVIGSISLIYNAFAISVSERSRQFGMLISVGATARQVRHSVLFEAMVIGCVGIPIGILAGIVGIGTTLKLIEPMLASSLNAEGGLTLSVSILSVALAALIGMITILVSAAIPAKRASRISAVDALRQTQDIKLTAKAVKTSRLVGKLFGFEGEIALKNLKRSRRRYRATVFSLIISIVLFIGVSTFSMYLMQTESQTYVQANYDVAAQLPSKGAGYDKTLANRIFALEGIQNTSIQRQIYASAKLPNSYLAEQLKADLGPAADGERNMVIFILSDDKLRAYLDENKMDTEVYFKPDRPQAVYINAMRYYDASNRMVVGDIFSSLPQTPLEVLFTGYPSNDGSNEAEPKSLAVHIGMLTKVPPFGVESMSYGLGQSIIVMSDTVFEQAIRPLLEEGYRDQWILNLKTDDPAQLTAKIEEIYRQEHIANVYGVNNIYAYEQMNRNTMIIMGVFVYGFITLITLVTLANVFNTISTNVQLRAREFGMLRSVGMTGKSFNRMVLLESMFYGLKALLYGLPVSCLFSIWINIAIGQGVSGISFILPWNSIIACSIGVLVVVLVIMRYSMTKIKRMNVVDALKMENF